MHREIIDGKGEEKTNQCDSGSKYTYTLGGIVCVISDIYQREL